MSDNKKEYNLESRLIDFAVLMIKTAENLPNTRAGNHIGGQLVKSGTAPAPHYGEAQSAESRDDFIHKMKIGLKELQETRVWLLIIIRCRYSKALPLADKGLPECQELIKIFAKSISTAKSNKRLKNK